MNIPAYWFTAGVIHVQPFSAPGHPPLSPDPCPNVLLPSQGRQGTCRRSCSSSFNSIVEETGSRPDCLRPASQAAQRAGPDSTSRCSTGRAPAASLHPPAILSGMRAGGKAERGPPSLARPRPVPPRAARGFPRQPGQRHGTGVCRGVVCAVLLCSSGGAKRIGDVSHYQRRSKQTKMAAIDSS